MMHRNKFTLEIRLIAFGFKLFMIEFVDVSIFENTHCLHIFGSGISVPSLGRITINQNTKLNEKLIMI